MGRIWDSRLRSGRRPTSSATTWTHEGPALRFHIGLESVEDLKRDLDEWLGDSEADQEASLELDSEAIAKLRSLGYVSVGSGSRDSSARERPNPMTMIEQHVGLERARALLADRFYDQAVRHLESVLRRDPENLAAMIDLVRAQEGLGEIDEAARVAERALDLDPDYVQTYLVLARLESQRERLDQALKLTELAIERDPISPEPRILKATFLNRLGRQDEMQDELEGIIADHPEHPRSNAVYAHLVEARGGKLAEAESRLRQVLDRDPFLDQAWLFLGRVLERQKRSGDAVTSYQKGLVSRPDDPELHGALGHLFAKLGDKDQAVVQLREAIRLSPKPRTELHVSLGAVLAEMGRGEEAEREYNKVLAMDPEHPGARNNAAIALYRSGRADEARTALEAIIAGFPRQVDAHNNLAAIAVDQERWSDVIRHSRQTLKLAPKMVEAWNNLGIGLEETQKAKEAVDAYERALSIDPGYWPAHFNLGVLLKKTGDPEAAAHAFEEVLARIPSHGDTHLELGELFAGSLADPSRARKHWNAFLRHAPNHPRISEIRQRLATL